MRRWLRMLAMIVLGIALLVAAAVGVVNYRDQTTLAAQAGATPQVPAEAAGQEGPIGVRLPCDLNVATVNLLRGRSDVTVLDVRTQAEYDSGHVPGALLIPLDQLGARLGDVPRDGMVVAVCRTGRRSARAVELLQAEGFADVHNTVGGMRAWNKAGFEVE